MARAFLRLAAIATCIALSLTGEDRQARSGDLDRGPFPEEGVQPAGSFKERKNFSYLDNVREFVRNNFRPPFGDDVTFRKNNYLPRLGEIGDRRSSSYDTGIYLVQEVPIHKHEKEVAELEGEDNGDNIKIPKRADQEQELKFKNQFKNIDELKTFSNEKKSKASVQPSPKPGQIIAETNILNSLSNLRYKQPFGVNPSTDTSASSSKLRNRQMRSETLENFKTENPLKQSISEISFEISNEEAMALKRRVELSTEFFLVPSSSTPVTSTSGVHITKTIHPDESDKIGGVFRNEVWVVPVIALSAVTMLLIAGFEVFVLCKAWRTTPSRRHLFLGQMLLLGLFSCAGLASVAAASPTQFTCALMRFGTGVAYAIVFASLLVKCVFLISLNGGVYLPAPYQGLLLLFAILIQVAIGVQWLLTSPPLVDNITVEQVVQRSRNRLLVTAADITNTQVIPLCRTPYVDIVLSLIYVIFLIIFVTVLAVKSRGIRDNYREATYIGLSVGCSIPTWLIWTVSGLVVNERHRDACIAFGLVIISIMVFLIMFMPKGRQLAAMGKEGVYVEDREERFCSLSRAGSGYSPSFFHFKPIKYGINHGTKQQHITTLGGGGGGGGR